MRYEIIGAIIVIIGVAALLCDPNAIRISGDGGNWVVILLTFSASAAGALFLMIN